MGKYYYSINSFRLCLGNFSTIELNQDLSHLLVWGLVLSALFSVTKSQLDQFSNVILPPLLFIHLVLYCRTILEITQPLPLPPQPTICSSSDTYSSEYWCGFTPKQVSLISYNNFALYLPTSVATFCTPASFVVDINVLSFLKSANLCFFSLPDSLPCAFTLTEYELVF